MKRFLRVIYHYNFSNMALTQYLSLPVLYATVILILTWLVLYLYKKNRNLPPGPWGLPFIGYYPFISTPHLHFIKLSEKYGKVFSFRTLGGRLIIVLNGAKIIRDVLVNRADEFNGKPFGNSLVSWISHGKGIAQEEGPAWKEQRRFFLQVAKNSGFGKTEVEGLILDEIQDMLEDLKKSGGKPVNLEHNLAPITNSVISQVLFSKKLSKTESFMRIVDGLHCMTQVFAGNKFLLIGPMFDLVMSLSTSMRKVREGRDLSRKITDEFINEHIKTLDTDQPRDYIDTYLLHRNYLRKKGKLDESSFTIERLQANSFNFFFEGTESISFAIANLLVEISKYPEVQENVQRELDNVIGRDRIPSIMDRQSLPYLESTIQELFRLGSPFVITQQFSNLEETEIEGYKIPRRSSIVANLWSISVDPEIFPQPEKFDPQRYLNTEGERIKLHAPYPFSLGKRSCVGEALAQMEVFLVIVSVLQKFKVLPGENKATIRVVPRS